MSSEPTTTAIPEQELESEWLTAAIASPDEPDTDIVAGVPVMEPQVVGPQ